MKILSLLSSLIAVIALSVAIPPSFSSLRDAMIPRFDPVVFGLPSQAREVIARRTEKAVTFELSTGKFAAVSAGEFISSPSCIHASIPRFCSIAATMRAIIPAAFANSEGPNSPDTMADDSAVGTKTWSNTANAISSNNGYATATGESETTNVLTHYLKATDFDFAIPANATIDGVVTEFEKKCSSNDGTDYCKDSVVKLVKGGTVQGDNLGDTSTKWSTTDGYIGYGSSSNLWGLTFLYSDINATDFGAVMSASISTDAGTVTSSIDHIRITVYYTAAAAAAVPFFSWWSLPLMLLGCVWLLHREGYFLNQNEL